MVGQGERQAWGRLGSSLGQTFQSWGQQRARRSEFDAQMAMAELQRRDVKEANQSLVGIQQATLELKKQQADRDATRFEEELADKDEMDKLRTEAATAYNTLYTPKQLPPGPSERYQSATSPPPGTPRAMGKPRFDEPGDIAGTLKGMGVSEEVIQSILGGEQGPLPITEKPREATPQEMADYEKTRSETEENYAQTYRILNPIKSTGGGGGSGSGGGGTPQTDAPQGVVGEIQTFLGGDVTPNQAMDLLWRTTSGESAIRNEPLYDKDGNPMMDVYKNPMYKSWIDKSKGGYQMAGGQWDTWREQASGQMGLQGEQGGGDTTTVSDEEFGQRFAARYQEYIKAGWLANTPEERQAITDQIYAEFGLSPEGSQVPE